MNELNRNNLEIASEWLTFVEEMENFLKKVAKETQSDEVRSWYNAAIRNNKELHYSLWRGISSQLVEEYN